MSTKCTIVPTAKLLSSYGSIQIACNEVWLCFTVFDIMGGVASRSEKNQVSPGMALDSPLSSGSNAQPSPPWSPALLILTGRRPWAVMGSPWHAVRPWHTDWKGGACACVCLCVMGLSVPGLPAAPVSEWVYRATLRHRE